MEHPGRISLNTSLSFVLISICFFILCLKKNLYFSFFVIILASIVLTIPFVSLVGYITGLEVVSSSKNLAKMALHTAIGTVLMSLALIAWGIIETLGKPIQMYALSIAVSLATAIVTLGFWRLIKTKEIVTAHLEAQSAANEIKNLVNQMLREDVEALRRFAQRWEAVGGYSDTLWNVDAGNYISDLPALKSIYIANTNLDVVRQTRIIHRQAFQSRSTVKEAQPKIKEGAIFYSFFSPSRVLEIFIPIKVNGQYTQYIYATINLQKLFYLATSSVKEQTYKVLFIKDDKVIFSWDEVDSPSVGTPIKIAVAQNYSPVELVLYATKAGMKTVNRGSEILMASFGILAAFLTGAVVFYYFKARSREEVFSILNKDLELAKEKAKLATQAKSAFLANMSHEIRTPLNAILGTIQLLKESELNDMHRKYINRIDFSGRLLLTLVNDILDYSKIEAGNITIERIPMDIVEVTQRIGESFMQKAASKNVALYLDLPDQPLPQVLGDAHRLEQILINLLTNAYKFTEQGEVNLKMVCQPNSPSSALVRFEISDSGMGISRENQSKLFQRFSQAEASHARKFGGVGLGLSICKGLTEKMEGKIGVNSEEGKGATFWIEVPFTFHKPEDTPPPYNLENIPILVLNTNDRLKNIILRYLSAWKAQVKTEFSDDLSQVQLAIISVDQGELVQKVKDKNLPVLYVDYNNPMQIKEDFLVLPISPKSLWASIQKKRGK